MVTEEQIVTEYLDLPPVDGWERQTMRAGFRNLPWADVCSELIDNASAFRKVKEKCTVRLEWNTKGRMFACTDHGIGATDAAPFIQCGKSAGSALEHGSSTFGTGLFVVESDMDGRMIISSASGTQIMVVSRSIQNGRQAAIQRYPNTTETRREFRLPDEGGTQIAFHRIRKGKSIPQAGSIPKLAAELSERYGRAIRDGSLDIMLIRNGDPLEVAAANAPKVEELFTHEVVIKGHRFTAEWGVTIDSHRIPGVELIYGGKRFTTTAVPCGRYNLSRFYGAITIPRTVGSESMDLLKRDVETAMMSTVYDKLEPLFKPQLERSHLLSSTEMERELGDRIAAALLRDRHKPQEGREKQRNSRGVTEGGREDVRKYKGRDPDGIGVEPKKTGRKRGGKKRRDDLRDRKITPVFQSLGERRNIAEYDLGAHRITYNTDYAHVSRWKEQRNIEALALIASAMIADRLRASKGGYAEFAFQLSKLLRDAEL